MHDGIGYAPGLLIQPLDPLPLGLSVTAPGLDQNKPCLLVPKPERKGEKRKNTLMLLFLAV